MMARIVVPKDRQAMVALDYDQASEDQLIELYYPDDDPEFALFWDSGIFSTIDNLADTLIDRYESEWIEDLTKIDKVIKSKIFDIYIENESLRRNFANLKRLFEEAYERGTGIYFFF